MYAGPPAPVLLFLRFACTHLREPRSVRNISRHRFSEVAARKRRSMRIGMWPGTGPLFASLPERLTRKAVLVVLGCAVCVFRLCFDSFTYCEVSSRSAPCNAQAFERGHAGISRCSERDQSMGRHSRTRPMAQFCGASAHVPGCRLHQRICGVQHPAKPLQAHHCHSLCKDNQRATDGRTRLHPFFPDA